MAAEQHVAPVVNRHRLDPRLRQQAVDISYSRAIKRITGQPQPRRADQVQIHLLRNLLQVGGLQINGFHSGGLLRQWGRSIVTEPCLHLLGNPRHGRGAVGSGKLDAIVVGRIVRGGKVDGSVGLQTADGARNGWCGHGLLGQIAVNAVARQKLGRHGREFFREEPCIITDNQ